MAVRPMGRVPSFSLREFARARKRGPEVLSATEIRSFLAVSALHRRKIEDCASRSRSFSLGGALFPPPPKPPGNPQLPGFGNHDASLPPKWAGDGLGLAIKAFLGHTPTWNRNGSLALRRSCTETAVYLRISIAVDTA